MKFVVPITIDDSNLTTNVVNEAVDWTAGTYATGVQKVEGELVYEVVATPSTTDQPSVGAAKAVPTWVVMGYANKWRMWREGSDSVSTRTGTAGITCSITPLGPAAVTTVGVLGLDALSVTVTVTDSIDGLVYNETKDVADIGVPDWWSYFFTTYDRNRALIFEDLPAYFGTGVTLAISINPASPTDEVECGRVVIGPAIDAGQSLQGVTSRNISFGTKERDPFGNLTLVNQRTIRVIDYPVMIPKNNVNSIQRKAAELAVIPTLFIGDSDMPETIVFGVFENFDVIINGLSVVECSIAVEEF